jgi:hypothetical protein
MLLVERKDTLKVVLSVGCLVDAMDKMTVENWDERKGQTEVAQSVE